MKGCLLAHKYLKLFKLYPERDFPYPDEIKDPHPSRPYNPKKKKKAGSNFNYPKWCPDGIEGEGTKKLED